jgi:hypothetical protein
MIFINGPPLASTMHHFVSSTFTKSSPEKLSLFKCKTISVSVVTIKREFAICIVTTVDAGDLVAVDFFAHNGLEVLLEESNLLVQDGQRKGRRVRGSRLGVKVRRLQHWAQAVTLRP